MKLDRSLLLVVAVAGQVACSKGCGEDLPSPDICWPLMLRQRV